MASAAPAIAQVRSWGRTCSIFQRQLKTNGPDSDESGPLDLQNAALAPPARLAVGWNPKRMFGLLEDLDYLGIPERPRFRILTGVQL